MVAKKRKQYPSQARLRELFDYDPEGFLIRLPDVNKSQSINTRDSYERAGCWGLKEDGLVWTYRVSINNQSFSGGALIWLWHGNEIPDGFDVFRKDWGDTCKIENLFCSKRKGKKNRPTLAEGKHGYGYKGVYKKAGSIFWCVEDANGDSCFFGSMDAAATHYDNVCETTHGYRPNQTSRRSLDSERVNKSIALYVSGARRSIKKRGIVGVYEKRKKWQARCAKMNIGTFSTKEDAARAYNRAARDHYGEHAVLNDVPDPFGDGDVF